MGIDRDLTKTLIGMIAEELAQVVARLSHFIDPPRPSERSERAIVIGTGIHSTLAALLRSHGYEVEVCDRASMAIERCRKMQPALVLSDIILEDMNAIDVGTIMCRLAPNSKTVFFSGQKLWSILSDQEAQYEILMVIDRISAGGTDSGRMFWLDTTRMDQSRKPMSHVA